MKIVVVENVSFDGEYRRGVILLNARLMGEKRVAVLRHEACHSRFYEFTAVGKFLQVFIELFESRIGCVCYGLLFCLLWFVNSFVFLLASVPLLLVQMHEAFACIRYGGRLSLVRSFCVILVYVVCFVVRLAFC